MGLPEPRLRAERARRGQAAWPLRVIVSNSGRIGTDLRVFGENFSPILIYSTSRMPASVRKKLASRAALHLSDGAAVDLRGMLADLRSRYDVRRVVCEGGGALFRSLLEAGLIHELNLTLCPLIFGGEKAPSLTGLPGSFLPPGIRARIAEMKVAGGECFLRYVLR